LRERRSGYIVAKRRERASRRAVECRCRGAVLGCRLVCYANTLGCSGLLMGRQRGPSEGSGENAGLAASSIDGPQRKGKQTVRASPRTRPGSRSGARVACRVGVAGDDDGGGSEWVMMRSPGQAAGPVGRRAMGGIWVGMGWTAVWLTAGEGSARLLLRGQPRATGN